MRFGIDFGTTRTVVAVADRGNYPVVSFQSESGELLPWYPALIAARGGEILFGLDAQSHIDDPGWCFLRSLKRLMTDHGPQDEIALGETRISVPELLTRYLCRLREDLRERSNVEIDAGDQLEATVAAPANANSNQRFLTIDSFRRAGFRVLGMINEPSAAGIEYAQRSSKKDGTQNKEHLVVYDLGGGTFDASIIAMKSRHYDVVTDEGIGRLGGDDFDEILMDLALAQLPVVPALTPAARFQLLEECRRQKEGLHPNTRKLPIDMSRSLEGAGEVTVTTAEYYERCAPLVEETIAAVELAVARATRNGDFDWNSVAAVYLVGGSSDLPIVSRMLRDRYGRRVRRSAYPYSATAIGLAIAADGDAEHFLRERFTRYFGVWREAESGRNILFDPIFPKDTPLPASSDPPLASTRWYSPAHNIGHFRYLECSQISDTGQPFGDITPWQDILFGMDAALNESPSLEEIEVRRLENHSRQMVREEYRCDSRGIIEVTIANETAGYQRTFRLGDLSGGVASKKAASGRKRTARGSRGAAAE
jgi:molecular chaperone DnaK (HSP70)